MTTTMPWEASQAAMSWTVASTSRSPGFATRRTARGLPFHCIMVCCATLDGIVNPSLTMSGRSPMEVEPGDNALDLVWCAGDTIEATPIEDCRECRAGGWKGPRFSLPMHAERERPIRAGGRGTVSSSSAPGGMKRCGSRSQTWDSSEIWRAQGEDSSGATSSTWNTIVYGGCSACSSRMSRSSLCTRPRLGAPRLGEPSRQTTQGVARMSSSSGSGGGFFVAARFSISSFAAFSTPTPRDSSLSDASSRTFVATVRTMDSMDCEPPTQVSGSAAQRANSRRDSRTACSKRGCNASAIASQLAAATLQRLARPRASTLRAWAGRT
mmetsp:Transcript_101379/g.295343  ORF Transcript_101379/g.295343 Transcript_101379/m.295343 type:complete len:325 (-) Transcript_101379:37-1011(-)